MLRIAKLFFAGLAVAGAPVAAAAATTFFSTGDPDGKMAVLSQPDFGGKLETETADDFVLRGSTSVTSATFTGLLTSSTTVPDVSQVVVEIYRIFPVDSNSGRTPQVPSRVNSPSDNALDSRTSGADLTFSAMTLNTAFTAANSVINGINPKPGVFTGGEGSATGSEVQFTVDFTTPFDLAAGHYFFVPQVAVTGGDFLWLSAPRPIVPPGTPFPTGITDLQAWTRNANLDPDWLRVGTDITQSGPFNMTFSLAGVGIPEPASWGLMMVGLAAMGAVLRRGKRSVAA